MADSELDAERNLRLLREIEANRAFVLLAYASNPELRKLADPEIRRQLDPLPDTGAAPPQA